VKFEQFGESLAYTKVF